MPFYGNKSCTPRNGLFFGNRHLWHDLRNRIINRKPKFRENWEKQKLSFFNITRNVNFKMLQRGEIWVFLSAVFGDRQRNMPRSPRLRKMKIFLKQNFETKNKNFHFWKFPGMIKRCEFWVFMSAVFGDRQRNMSKRPPCHKMDIFFRLMTRLLRSCHIFHFINIFQFRKMEPVQRKVCNYTIFIFITKIISFTLLPSIAWNAGSIKGFINIFHPLKLLK